MMFETVRDIIAKELGLDKDSITLESRLTEDLGADSLDAVEIIMALEEKIGKEIDDSNFQDIKTVGDIVRCIEELTK
ncbi:MAG: acyl carrier protein [Bacilli bacterium]|nr:acyl carrier protein [Bacilli bacterium]